MDLEGLRTGAEAASQTATTMQASLPGVLTELKGSLNQIFNKDNPLVKERTGQLENYLSAGDKARASYLPQNSGFAYSPTELNALVSSRQASALAPLASTNQMLMGQYGGLKDYLGQAKDLFGARTQAAYENAQLKRQGYTDAVSRQQQEFENKLALDKLKKEKSGLGGLNWPTSKVWQPTEQQPTQTFAGPTQADFKQGTVDPSLSFVPNLNTGNKYGWIDTVKGWFGGGNQQPMLNIPSGTNLNIQQ